MYTTQVSLLFDSLLIERFCALYTHAKVNAISINLDHLFRVTNRVLPVIESLSRFNEFWTIILMHLVQYQTYNIFTHREFIEFGATGYRFNHLLYASTTLSNHINLLQRKLNWFLLKMINSCHRNQYKHRFGSHQNNMYDRIDLVEFLLKFYCCCFCVSSVFVRQQKRTEKKLISMWKSIVTPIIQIRACSNQCFYATAHTFKIVDVAVFFCPCYNFIDFTSGYDF